MAETYAKIVSLTKGPANWTFCALAHSRALGYLAAVAQGKQVDLYRVSDLVRVETMTPPAAQLDYASWPLIAASDNAACVVYGASYNGATKVTRYLQVWRFGVLSPPLKLADISSEWHGSEKSSVVWSGSDWLVSTRVRGAAGNPEVLLQHVSLDGLTITASVRWAIPGESLFGASLLVDDQKAYAAAFSGLGDVRKAWLAEIDLATMEILSDRQVDDGSRGGVDTVCVSKNDGAIEVLWYAGGKSNGPAESVICSRKDFGAITIRAHGAGDLAVSNDSRLIGSKEQNSGYTGVGSAAPTLLIPYVVGQGDAYKSSMAFDGASWLVSAIRTDGVHFWALGLTDEAPPMIEAPPSPPPLPVDHFGQRSDRITDGTALDLRHFVFGAASTFPRTKAHGIHQVETAPGVFALVKFQQARAYELWSVGPNYIHHLEDASDGRTTADVKPGDPPPQTYRFTDTRWMPNVWKVGESFILPPHFADFFNRDTGGHLEHRSYDRRMQIVDAWEQFDCGPDLGIRRVICVLYDPTGGAHSDRRFVELFYFAEGAGWIGWWPHRSDRCFANGGQKFDATTQSEDLKGFYLFGSKATAPALTGLANSPTEISPVNLPDYSQTVRDIAATGGYKLESKEGDGIFTRAVARILHKVNPRIGLLRKGSGQNHVVDLATGERHAVDNILHLDDSPGQSVAIDIVSASESPQAGPSWGPDIPRYSASDWFAPAPISASSIERPALPLTKAVTAFDLLTHMNQAWIDLFAKDEAFVVVAQSVYRRPRTLAEGRMQLGRSLPTFAAQGRKVIVIVNCDTAEYAKSEGLDAEGIRNNTKAINAYLVANASAVAAVVLGNENNNGNELPIMGDPAFIKELCGYIDPRFPLAPGHFWCAEAGEIAAIGSWLSVHSDRGATPEANGLTMAALAARFNKKVGDREPKAICEDNDPRVNTSQRTKDPAEIGRQGAAAVRHGLCLSVLHSSAGVEGQCAPEAFGANHRAALAEWRKALGSTPPPSPTPMPPPSGSDPILDAPLAPSIPVGYRLFVANYRKIEAAAIAWYRKAHGHAPADGDIAHGLWRALYEGDRWRTLRAAFTDTWGPGGAP